MADAVQPERDRNLARHHADDRHGNGVRRHLAAALDEEVVVLPLAHVDAAAAAADDDARSRLADGETGVGPGFPRGDDADERRARVPLRIRPVIGIPQVVAVERRHVGDRHRRHRRGDAAAEIGGVESGDGARTAAAAAHRQSGLAAVTGEHYEGGHWLGSFAVYLTTKRGITSAASPHQR